MSNNWKNYWSKKNIWGSSNIWKKNSQILSENFKKIYSIKNKNILDIGCGTGELIENFVGDANKIYGVDISKDYIKTCKDKFKNKKKVRIILFKNNYNNLYKTKNKFDLMFCNSVIQYFTNEDEIIELVKAVKRVSKKGSKFLISDIMDINEKKNLIKFIYFSVVRGYLYPLLKQFVILIFKPKYRELENKYKLLKIDINKTVKKIRPLSNSSRIIDDPLTINVNRKHILIKF